MKNNLSKETKTSMRTRIITAIIGVVIILPCIVLGNWFYFALIAFALIIAVHEIIRTPKKKFSVFLYIFTYVIVFSLTYWGFMKHGLQRLQNSGDFFDLAYGFQDLFISTIAIAVSIGVLFLVSIIDKNFSITDVFYFICMTLMVSLCFQAILMLRYFPQFIYQTTPFQTVSKEAFEWGTSSFLLVYALLGSFVTDSGAYFVGVFAGKHKMNERISPKKTWEGFAGGIIISFVVTVGFAFLMDAIGCPILPILTINNWYWVLLVSAVMPFAAVLGDFLFSAIKRHYNIKDFGYLLPGHGGILDRIDSVFIVALAVCILVYFISTGWNFI